MTAETYGHSIIPKTCTQGTISSGQTVTAPVAYLAVYINNNLQETKYYVDTAATPIIVSSYNAGDEIKIASQYEFMNSPGNDVTVKIYSKHTGI